MRISYLILPLLLAALPCLAQQQSQQQDQDKDKNPPPATQQAPAAKKPTTADDNPFPEEISKKAAQADDSSAPDAPTGKADKPPRSPGESKPGEPQPDEPDYSSSRTKFQDIDVMGDKESRISNGAGGYILNPTLAAQDVKVGGFYLNAGDYKGAYTRYKEATEVNPENADAVFGLAEAARGLKLKDVAADNYRMYLDAYPDGPKAKAARKALAQLGAAPKK
jgi:tetratricopeptide (TPR) repeat protein